MKKILTLTIALLSLGILENSAGAATKRSKAIHFTGKEDDRLKQLVSQHGMNDWKAVAAQMPNRDARQCRDRYMSYLAPHINKEPFTPEEDRKIEMLYNKHGPYYATIAREAGYGRTSAAVKNRLQKLRVMHNREMLRSQIELQKRQIITAVMPSPGALAESKKARLVFTIEQAAAELQQMIPPQNQTKSREQTGTTREMSRTGSNTEGSMTKDTNTSEDEKMPYYPQDLDECMNGELDFM